ncbi:MAG: hypothetical protein RMY36_033340 [Nostoc sp. SerVER01]
MEIVAKNKLWTPPMSEVIVEFVVLGNSAFKTMATNHRLQLENPHRG